MPSSLDDGPGFLPREESRRAPCGGELSRLFTNRALGRFDTTVLRTRSTLKYGKSSLSLLGGLALKCPVCLEGLTFKMYGRRTSTGCMATLESLVVVRTVLRPRVDRAPKDPSAALLQPHAGRSYTVGIALVVRPTPPRAARLHQKQSNVFAQFLGGNRSERLPRSLHVEGRKRRRRRQRTLCQQAAQPATRTSKVAETPRRPVGDAARRQPCAARGPSRRRLAGIDAATIGCAQGRVGGHGNRPA